MSSGMKCPGSARQRATGAKMEHVRERHSHPQTYATCADLQRRHVMRRLRVGSRQATIIAALFFGEDGQ
jgi:hypothetical protein